MDPPDPHRDVPGKIASAFERIAQATGVLTRREADAHGLSPIQLRLLLRLAADPPARWRPGALAREFDVSAASLSDSIGALERKGLVQRHRLSGDRRGTALHLTPGGLRLAQEARTASAPVVRAVAALPVGEQEELMVSLFSVIAALQEEGVITVARMCITCTHFRADAHEGPRPHHCALIDAPLAAADLRVNCPEHERAA